MHHRQFDHYLALLGSLLKLGRRQRHVIAAELRDHLEERVAALVARGVPEKEATAQALDDLGDARTLARRLSQIAHERKRRFAMKCFAACLATLTALVVLVYCLQTGSPDPSPDVAVASRSPGEAPVEPTSLQRQQDLKRAGIAPYRLAPPDVLLLQVTGGKLMELDNHEYLIGPDGSLNLGDFGSVYVTGMTLAEAKQALESHLAQHNERVQVAVEVYSYNSKVVYVIEEQPGGDKITQLPCLSCTPEAGEDTVAETISRALHAAPPAGSQVWIARPISGKTAEDQILPIDWQVVSSGTSLATNYLLLPSDRIYVRRR